MTAAPYPLFLHLERQHVLVVGGGQVGLRKTLGLLKCQAIVTVISETFAGKFPEHPNLRCVAESYTSMRMAANGSSPWRIVFAATSDAHTNRRVYEDARGLNILCCRCDNPEEGDFSGGAVWQSPGITLAVSSQGASPILAVRMRDAMRSQVDPLLTEFAELLAQWRQTVRKSIAAPAVRKALLTRLASEEMEGVLRRRGRAAAQQLFNQWVAETLPGSPEAADFGAGSPYEVGGGPANPHG